MRIIQKTNISAEASAVWPFIVDPVLHADWNPKVISIGRQKSGPVECGEWYELIYRLGSREKQISIEVTVVEPFRRLTFRHGDARQLPDRTYDESFEFVTHADGVRIVRTMDLSRVGMPWPLRLLFWFVRRFGWDADVPQLERLKRLVEASAAGGGDDHR